MDRVIASATRPSGSDLVYVFNDTVRPECRDCNGSGHHEVSKYELAYGCWFCGGSGWKTETDIIVWQLAVVNAGASVVRTWWDRKNECWWGDVRLIETHEKSDTVRGSTPDEALFGAIELATKRITGVKL